MKIGEYEQMMSYLTRPEFAEGTGPIVEPPKSMQIDTTTKNPIPEYDINDFRNDAEIFVLAYHNDTLPREDIAFKLNSFAQKGIDAGTFTMEDAAGVIERLKFETQDRAQKQRLRGIVPEGIGTVDREDKAIGGGAFVGEELPNDREGFAGIKKVKNVKKFENKFPGVKLGDYYYEIRNPNYLGKGKGDSPRISIGPFKNKKTAQASYDARQKKVVNIKKANLKETKTLYDAQTQKINKFVTDFYNNNITKYGLRDYDLFEKDLFEAFENSGIGDAKKRKAIAIGYPNVGKFSSAGVKGSKFPLTLFGIKARMASGFKIESDAAAFFKKAFYSAQLAKKPKLVENLKKYLEYYNTDKKYYGLQNEVNRAALQKEYADVLDPRVKSDLLFLLESDDIGTGNLRRGFLRVYIPEQYDAYVAKKGQASLRYKRLVNDIENSLTNNQLKRALNGATSIKSFMTNQTNLLNEIFDTSALKKAGYGELIFNADHLEGIAEIARMDNAEDKIRGLRNIVGTTAARNYELGMQGFSVQRKGLMNKIKNGINIEPNVKKLNEITKIAYPEFEGNLYKYNAATKSAVPTRNFIVEYDPETAFRQYFKDLIKSPVGLKELKKQYTNNPELQKVIKKDKSLASQIDKTYKIQYYANKAGKLGIATGLTAPLILGIKKEISEGRDPFSMSAEAAETGQLPEGSPKQINPEEKSFLQEYPLTTGALAAASPLVTKPGRKIYGSLAKSLLKAFGSVPAATYFAGKELSKDDPNYAIAGADLLLPELGKRVAGSGTGIMAKAGRFLTNPIGRLARGFTPAGIVLQGVELVNQAMKEQDRINNMRETNPEAYEEYLAEQEDLLRESAAYGGRMGFADGPEDPSKRKFMKIMGGLASLPIIGRFFDVAKEASPIIEAVKTEVVKGKPEWFDALVNKVITMGEDVTKRFATKERETVNQVNIADGETVRVYQDLETNSIRVEYESPDNMGEGSVDLVYKKELPDESNPSPSADFYVTELEPRGVRTGPDDYDVEFDGENYGNSIDELMSDTTKLKEFATGQKRTMKEIVESKKKKDKTKAMNESTLEQAEYLESKYGPGDDLYYQDYSDYD